MTTQPSPLASKIAEELIRNAASNLASDSSHIPIIAGQISNSIPVALLVEVAIAANRADNLCKVTHSSSCSIQDADEPRCDCGADAHNQNFDDQVGISELLTTLRQHPAFKDV